MTLDNRILRNFYRAHPAGKVMFSQVCQGCHCTGKTGNLKVHFSREGKHREFAEKYFTNMFLHREFTTNTGTILRVQNNNELVI